MELIKVRDNQNRPISGLDIMMSAVFGDKIPKEFVPGGYYRYKDHVYKIDGAGNLLIYECTKEGKYYNCTYPEFKEWSLDSIIESYNEKLMSDKENIIKNAQPKLYDFKSVDTTNYTIDSNNNVTVDISPLSKLDYSRPYDIFDVFIKKGATDRFLLPSDYTVDNSSIKFNLNNLISLGNVNCVSKFFPEGIEMDTIADTNIITTEEYPDLLLGAINEDSKFFSVGIQYDEADKNRTYYYWYNEDGIEKTYKFTSSGINVNNVDILSMFIPKYQMDYEVLNFKIESVHTIVESPLNPLQDKQVYRLDKIEVNGRHDAIGFNVNKDVQTVTIPITIEPTRDLTDELTVTFNRKTQTIAATSKNGYIKQIQFSFTANETEMKSVYVIGGKSLSDATRYVKCADEIGEVATIENVNYIKFPKFELFKYNSFDFDLYINRVFISNYEKYMDENGCIYIKIDDDTIDYKRDEFLFHIYYSISQNIDIIKTVDIQPVTNDKEAFRIYLTREFINKYQWLRLYNDYMNIPPEFTVGSKSNANISDSKYYVDINKTLIANMFSLVAHNVKRLNGSMKDICNSESYPILSKTRDINIPFIDYDPENDDLLLFKSGGVLVSSAKWYLNDSQINMYSHETPFEKYDYVDFRLLDRDSNVRVYNKFATIDTDDQSAIKFSPIPDDDNIKEAVFMLFTMSGEFVSPSKYTRNGNTITFLTDCNQPIKTLKDMRFEAIIGCYTSDVSRTLYHTLQIPSTTDDQKEFVIDETVDFNMDTNNLLVFREDGMYIGEKFYHIDKDTNKIIIDKGTGVANGSHIDVIIIRNLALEFPLEIE